MEIFEKIVVCFQRYCGTGTQFLLFLCALFFLAMQKNSKKLHQIFVHYSCFIIAVMVFPISAIIIMDYFIGEEVYWRMFWLLPIPFVIAIAGVKLVGMGKSKWKKIGIFAFALLLIFASGKFVYESDEIALAANLEKLPEQAEEVCNAINADALANHIEQKKVVVPSELLSYIRQYDATILMPYGRNALKDEGLPENCENIFEMMKEEKLDCAELSGYLKQESCNYLVLSKEKATSKFDAYGYYQVDRTEEYVIFRCDEF